MLSLQVEDSVMLVLVSDSGVGERPGRDSGKRFSPRSKGGQDIVLVRHSLVVCKRGNILKTGFEVTAYGVREHWVISVMIIRTSIGTSRSGAHFMFPTLWTRFRLKMVFILVLVRICAGVLLMPVLP